MNTASALAADLRRRGVIVSVACAVRLAAEHGLNVTRGARNRWVLYRRDGLGHPVLYHYLAELVAALAPPE